MTQFSSPKLKIIFLLLQLCQINMTNIKEELEIWLFKKKKKMIIYTILNLKSCLNLNTLNNFTIIPSKIVNLGALKISDYYIYNK